MSKDYCEPITVLIESKNMKILNELCQDNNWYDQYGFADYDRVVNAILSTVSMAEKLLRGKK